MAGIYIHIPFCKQKCHYCDFYKTLDTGLSQQFIKSLKLEIALRKDYIASEETIETIYLGGGTPSVLSLVEIRAILESVHSNFKVVDQPEITIELNPDDIDKLYLKGLKREGINRLSIGIQSWYDPILKKLNRRHNSIQSKAAVSMAIEAGFNNISIDLIYGIPGLTTEEWRESLLETFRLDIQHISAYHLTIEENTMFGKMKKLGELSEIREEESETQFGILTELAKDNGFIHYEISNLCKEGRFSKHNTNYWKQVNYIGLGPSAHSYNGYSRQWNISSLTEYMRLLETGKETWEKETIDETSRFNEYIMTTLRTMWGIDLNYLESSFNKEIHDYLLNVSSRFIKYGMIEWTDNNFLTLTNQGKMISDNIITELIMS